MNEHAPEDSNEQDRYQRDKHGQNKHGQNKHEQNKHERHGEHQHEAGQRAGDTHAEGPTDTPPGAERPEAERPSAERAEQPVTRAESWPCAGPSELDLSVDLGRIDITLDEAATEVHVELQADLGRSGWSKGLSELFGWLGQAARPAGSIRIGGHEINVGGRDFPFSGLADFAGFSGSDLGTEAVRHAEVSWSEPNRRLVVRSSTALPHRLVPLRLSVRAPGESRLILRSGAGEITVTGRAGTTKVRTGSGDVSLQDVVGDVDISTGSGRASIGAVSGRTRAKTGSGDLVLSALAGPAMVRSGSGDLRIGAVRADLLAHTGSGGLTVNDAVTGQLKLTTGSGDLRVGVHAGVAAELDLFSGSGEARSELQVSDTAPTSTPALSIHGRTGSGDVLVTRAS